MNRLQKLVNDAARWADGVSCVPTSIADELIAKLQATAEERDHARARWDEHKELAEAVGSDLHEAEALLAHYREALEGITKMDSAAFVLKDARTLAYEALAR